MSWGMEKPGLARKLARDAGPDADGVPTYTHAYTDGGRDGCEAHVQNHCLSEAFPPEKERSADELAWRRATDGRKAEETARGRACLARERAKCEKDPMYFHSSERLRRWLDAQLVPARRDDAAAKALEAKLEQATGAALEVVCARELCRVGLEDPQGERSLLPGIGTHLAETDASGVLLFGEHSDAYVSRAEWRFPGH